MNSLKEVKIFKEFENEDEKWRWKNEDFFYSSKIFQIIFFWNFELRWFQIRFQNFHIFLRLKLQSSKVGQFFPFLTIFDHFTLEGCNFWSKKEMKNLNTYLKSTRFKVSEKYKMKYFGRVEKVLIFSSSFFIFNFEFFEKF